MLATTLAVAIICGITLLADRVERGLLSETASFLAADLAIASGIEIPEKYALLAQRRGLQTALTAEFPSMVFHRDTNHLAVVKAVGDHYPLRGELLVAERAFVAAAESGQQKMSQAPRPGEVWVDERLLPLLDAEIGDQIEIGRLSLRMSRVLLSEPDRGTGFALVGARVLMNLEDLQAADLIKPGSRVGWRLLLAGDAGALRRYREEVEEQLSVHQQLLEPHRSEERLAAAVARGRGFLVLAGIIGLLLAGVVLGLSSKLYADRHIDQIALMKCWGLSSRRVRALLLWQLLSIGTVAAVAGVLLGWIVHLGLLAAVQELLPRQLPSAGLLPMAIAALAGPLCLAGFALPALWHLPAVSPLRVLRRDIPVGPVGGGMRLSLGALTICALAVLYARQFLLPLYLLAGLAAMLVLIMLLGLLLLRLARHFSRWSGSSWRLAVAGILRHRNQSLLQLTAIGLGTMLLMIITLVRGSLVDEWRMQVPPDAPNHFLVNVASWERAEIDAILGQRGLRAEPWYPMVRGRLLSIDGDVLEADHLRNSPAVDREVNLSWSSELPVGNRIVAGRWWADGEASAGELTVESELAEELEISVGDQLQFSVGGIAVDGRVVGIRELDWNSMNPNFFMLFAPGTLEQFDVNWISSLNIPSAQRRVVSDILQAHPTVMMVSLEEALRNIRSIIAQATRGLEMIFALVSICGLLVFFAATALSHEQRIRENALLRALGAQRGFLLRSVAVEFALLGAVAGVIAALGAELSVALLQRQVFDMQAAPHPTLWLAGPLAASVGLMLLGLWRLYPLSRVPPMWALRRYGT